MADRERSKDSPETRSRDVKNVTNKDREVSIAAAFKDERNIG
jgi:hypothetical protein